MAFDKYSYDQQYLKNNMITKRVPFNKLNPDDVEMLEYLEQFKNFTHYIKGLIKRDMEQNKP